MARRVALFVGLVVAVLAAALSVRLRASAERVPDVGQMAAPAAGMLSIVGPSLDPAAPAPGAPVIAFLPLVVKAGRCLHPAYLYSFDRTLAAFAAVFLERRVVAPERAEAAAREAGFAAPFTVASDTAPGPDRLRELGATLGADLLVWTELDPEWRVTVRTLAVDGAGGAADAAAWDGQSVVLAADPDVAVYDGPRALLATLMASGRFAGLSGAGLPAMSESEVPATLRERHSAAWMSLRSAHPGGLAHAEAELARIAAAAPRWPAPWVGVALTRALRPALYGSDRSPAVLAEGANPARHIAALFDLAAEPGLAAELAAVDLHSLMRGEEARSDLLGLAQALPDQALPSLLLAYLAGESPDELPALARFRPEIPLEAVLHEWVTSGDATNRLLALPPADLERELLVHPPLVHGLEQRASTQDWRGWPRWTRLRAALAASGAAQALFEVCADDGDAACRDQLATLVRAYVPDADLAAPAGAHGQGWIDGLVSAIATQPVAPAEIEPGVAAELAQADPDFAAGLVLARRLANATSRLLADRERRLAGIAAPAALLRAPARMLAAAVVDKAIAVAATRARVGLGRHVRDEVEPYVRALSRHADHLVSPLELRAEFHTMVGDQDAATRDTHRLLERDPYLRQPANAWIDYMHLPRTPECTLPYWDPAPGFACLLPRTPWMVQTLAFALRQEGKWDEAIAALDQALARWGWRQDLVDYRDRLAADAGRPAEDRLPPLERLSARKPRHGGLRARLAALHMSFGQLDVAERIYRDARALPGGAEPACSGLAELRALAGDMVAAREAYARCAEIETDRWTRIRLLNLVGRMNRDAGEFQEALRWHQRAQAEIGDAADVLDSLAATHALLGEPAKAVAFLDQSVERYKHAGAYAARARLLLATGDVDRALESLRPVVKLDGEEEIYEALRLAHLRAGSLESFEQTCRAQDGSPARRVLALALLEDRRDPDGAEAVLREIATADPRHPQSAETWGRVWLARADPARAEPLFARALLLSPDYPDAEIGRIRAVLAQGDRARAAALAEAYARARPMSVFAYEARAEILRADGNLAEAGRMLARARALYPYAWGYHRRFLVREAEDAIAAGDRAGAARLLEAMAPVLARIPEAAELWHAKAGLHDLRRDAAEAETARAQARLWNRYRFP